MHVCVWILWGMVLHRCWRSSRSDFLRLVKLPEYFSGSRWGERRSPRPDRGQERKGAEPPPQPSGGPHKQWDPLWPGSEGGGHRVSVSTVYPIGKISAQCVIIMYAWPAAAHLQEFTQTNGERNGNICWIWWLQCHHLFLGVVWCNSTVIFVRAFALIKFVFTVVEQCCPVQPSKIFLHVWCERSLPGAGSPPESTLTIKLLWSVVICDLFSLCFTKVVPPPLCLCVLNRSHSGALTYNWVKQSSVLTALRLVQQQLWNEGLKLK